MRETLEGICQGEGAESWTEVIAYTHFYPDLHGLFYTSNTVDAYKRIAKGNRSPIADPRMRGSIVGLTLVSPLRTTDGLSSFPDLLMHILGLVATGSRAQIRARPRGHCAPDPTHRREAQRRRALNPRVVPVWIASAERGAHAPLGERVQHARRAPPFARCIGRARRRDAGPLRRDGASVWSSGSGSRSCAMGYHAGDDASGDGRAARCWGEGEEAAGGEVSDFLGVD